MAHIGAQCTVGSAVAHIDVQTHHEHAEHHTRQTAPSGAKASASRWAGAGARSAATGEQLQQPPSAPAQCHATVATDETPCEWCKTPGNRAKGFRRGMCPACQSKARGILPPERLSPAQRMVALEDLARRVMVLDATARGVVLDALRVPREYRGCARRLVMDALAREVG